MCLPSTLAVFLIRNRPDIRSPAFALEKGDSVRPEKVFNISNSFLPLDVSLNILPFLHGKPQLDEHDVVETRRIASLRIHVETPIQHIKNFCFFNRPIPASLGCVPDQTFSGITLLPPLVKLY